MSREKQLTRQWRLMQKLSAAREDGVTVEDLTAAMECHRRTIYRDLNALQEAGFPLYNPDTPDKKTRWAILNPDRHHLPFPLEMTELMALYLSRDVLKILKGTFIYDNLDSLFKKIQVLLPEKALAFLKEVENNLYVKQRPAKQYQKTLTGLFTTINQAIADNRAVDMTYFTMSRGKNTRRRIDPYSLWYFDGSFYVIGYCHLRSDIRVFAVDRISDLHASSETFQRPADFSAREFMQTSFGVFQGSPIRVKVRFSPQAAGYVKEKNWHESQMLTELPDGSLDFEAKVAGTREIKLWILGWGAQARVLAPTSLKQEIREEIRAMQKQYL